MSDSDCSNCEDYSCSFRDNSYDCYKRRIKEVREHMTKADARQLKKLLPRIEKLHELSEEESFYQLAYHIKQTLDLFNGE